MLVKCLRISFTLPSNSHKDIQGKSFESWPHISKTKLSKYKPRSRSADCPKTLLYFGDVSVWQHPSILLLFLPHKISFIVLGYRSQFSNRNHPDIALAYATAANVTRVIYRLELACKSVSFISKHSRIYHLKFFLNYLSQNCYISRKIFPPTL